MTCSSGIDCPAAHVAAHVASSTPARAAARTEQPAISPSVSIDVLDPLCYQYSSPHTLAKPEVQVV
jgi:hypothetical protein